MQITRRQREVLKNAFEILNHVGAVDSAGALKHSFHEAFEPEQPELDEIQISDPENLQHKEPSLFKTLLTILKK